MKLQWFHVLLALKEGPLHGYAIQRAVLDATRDQLTLWPATLYRALGALEEEGLIQQVQTPPGESEDQRRLYYALTDRGLERLRVEADDMLRWAEAARETP